MKRTIWRPIAAITVLIATTAVFVWYFMQHPEIWWQLQDTSPKVITTLLALYLVGVVALAGITMATVRLCKLRLSAQEGLLLTMYSSIINFFGPLQSGPAFRGVYLKKKHNVNLKQFAVASLVYYCFYGGFSVLLLISGVIKWWSVPLAAIGLVSAYFLGKSNWLKTKMRDIDLRAWYYLALATFLQVSILTLIYYTELKTVSPGVHFSQALIYTGAANLALFVSLTPGAIGFRESFLVFSQNLHHISNNAIVAANIIDRAMYIVLLLILVVIIVVTQAKQQLGVESKTKK